MLAVANKSYQFQRDFLPNPNSPIQTSELLCCKALHQWSICTHYYKKQLHCQTLLCNSVLGMTTTQHLNIFWL